MDELPWVLLGLRSVPKQDMGVSVAEMVYGMPITVPGTFVGPGNDPATSDHLQRMQDIAGRLVPAPDAWHGTTTTASTRGLPEAEYVFVRRDAAHGPLQTPYTGPYRVLQLQEKFFVIQCGDRQESVSIDRLKPAIAEPERNIEPALPPRRGRPPKPREVQPPSDVPAETRPAATMTEPEQEQEQLPPTYVQVTRRGRVVRPPDRYMATATYSLPATTE